MMIFWESFTGTLLQIGWLIFGLIGLLTLNRIASAIENLRDDDDDDFMFDEPDDDQEP